MTNDEKRLLACIEGCKEVQEAIALEPALRTLLELAADPEPRENRWLSYEALKRLSLPLVGWDAHSPALRTSRHYDAIAQAFDALLPQPEEEVSHG